MSVFSFPFVDPWQRDPGSTTPLVLLAEDDDELRLLLARKLRRRGCAVVQARNGVELAQIIVERDSERRQGDLVRAELVISDIRMPGFTGLEILALLRQLDWAMPVILVTSFGDAETHAEARRLGARVFDKPFDLDELTTAACVAVGLVAD